MPQNTFRIFSDERFLDLTAYQYGYEQCRPLHSYGPHTRNHYLFHYIISGKGVLHVNNKDLSRTEESQVLAGQGFLIEPDLVATYYADQHEPWEYTWIEFDGLRAAELLKEAGLSASTPVFYPISEEAGHLLRDRMMYIVEHPVENPLCFIGFLYMILDALVHGSANRKKTQGGKLSHYYSQEAISFIEQYYASQITVEDMARQCNLDRSYFGKVFKDAMGQSPQEFLIRYRMNKASSLLVTTDLSISAISVQVGYPNQLHFSRAFKKIYGVSPRTYRQTRKLMPDPNR